MRPEETIREDPLARLGALEHALEQERKARQTAEAASKAKSDLLATVSHEVRTPMGAIISMADLLLSTHLDHTQRRYAETLQQSARGLLTVLNDILDYSKLEAGRFELEEVDFDFLALMDSIAAGLTARASEKGLDSALEIAEGCPRYMLGDPVRIRQVLNNLTDNALKFTEAGYVRLRVGYGLGGDDIMLRFEVCDTGIGLSEAKLQRICQPFTQGDSSIAAKYGGTGLGLSIVRRLAELMVGELGCESAEGSGSVFWFTARLRRAQPGTQPDKRRDDPADVSYGPLSGQVLIVEDNAVNQMLIAAYLEKFGLNHAMSANGREALEMVQQGDFDLVLMDIMMPEMDGIVATQRIRALPGPVGKLPIIALTANAMKGDRETYLKAGMDDYVSKPISARELFSVLAIYLSQRARAARA